MSLSRRVAIVTGAAQGLGKAIALRLARDGFAMGLNDLPNKQDALDDVAQTITKNGGRAATFFGDVTKEKDVQALVDGTADALGGLHVMVANAGIAVPAPFLDESLASFDRVNNVSVTGTFLCYQHAARKMIAQGITDGRLIGASSVAGKQPFLGLTSYCAAKFAIRGITQAAALSLGPHGITANAYAPGLIDTAIINVEGMREHANLSLQNWADVVPLKRHGEPEEIASLVSFLASKESGYITGQTISIDGGGRMS
ncbi:hypothetical protein BD626DRAFT_183068 [Schizophyllum amplum]|uniref:Acetoin reductase family protein n=1 Tax=Schizophyllum amplum TaxID=97359 RepID=A0A550C115_9AGAR|nr:hypothetical protein BD626DRAFT_183068 [Auriculariopsis ampla]